MGLFARFLIGVLFIIFVCPFTITAAVLWYSTAALQVLAEMAIDPDGFDNMSATQMQVAVFFHHNSLYAGLLLLVSLLQFTLGFGLFFINRLNPLFCAIFVGISIVSILTESSEIARSFYTPFGNFTEMSNSSQLQKLLSEMFAVVFGPLLTYAVTWKNWIALGMSLYAFVLLRNQWVKKKGPLEEAPFKIE